MTGYEFHLNYNSSQTIRTAAGPCRLIRAHLSSWGINWGGVPLSFMHFYVFICIPMGSGERRCNHFLYEALLESGTDWVLKSIKELPLILLGWSWHYLYLWERNPEVSLSESTRWDILRYALKTPATILPSLPKMQRRYMKQYWQHAKFWSWRMSTERFVTFFSLACGWKLP